MDEMTEKVLEIVSEKVYEDSLKPSMKVIGDVLSFIPRGLRVVFQPYEEWLIRREHNMKLFKANLEEALQDVSNDKIVLPEPQIAFEVLDAIGVCADSEYLRKMYAKLLAVSMNSDTREEAHPAYVAIIKQITPDEAKVLEYVWRNKDVSFKDVSVAGIVNFSIDRDIEVINGDNIKIVMETVQTYFENLERLKLVRIHGENNSITWDDLTKSPSIIHSDDDNDYDNKHVKMTIFGAKFCITCIGF